MKSLILIFLVAVSSSRALGASLKIYVIRPEIAISWVSPRTLAITSGLDSIGNDYAPIGHFAVKIQCDAAYGNYGKTVLTGMERQNKKESMRIVRDKGIGLGSLTYTFRGALQGAAQSEDEISRARKAGRLRSILIPTSEARCQSMMRFLDRWIQAGSYLNYGGGKKTELGEGAGCADFAEAMFKIATGTRVPPEWKVQLLIPQGLIGTPERRVELTSVLKATDWAHFTEPHVPYEIMDTDRVMEWFKGRLDSSVEEYFFKDHLFPTGAIYADGFDFTSSALKSAKELPAISLKKFKFDFSDRVTQSPDQIWKSVIVD